MSKIITIETQEGKVIYELANFGQRFLARFIDTIIIIIPNSIIPILPAWLYWALLQGGQSQATIGQQVMRIKVVSLTGNKVGFGQATGRFFGDFLNLFTFFVGYFLFFLTARNQCLHDLVSDCIVVNAKEIDTEDDIMRHLVES